MTHEAGTNKQQPAASAPYAREEQVEIKILDKKHDQEVKQIQQGEGQTSDYGLETVGTDPATVEINLRDDQSEQQFKQTHGPGEYMEYVCDPPVAGLQHVAAAPANAKDTRAPIELIIGSKEDKLVALNGLNKETSRPNGHRKLSTRSEPAAVPKSGRIRHVIAILALSSIVLANMNRQAYNQALVRMIRRTPATKQVEQNDDGQATTTTITTTAAPTLIDTFGAATLPPANIMSSNIVSTLNDTDESAKIIEVRPMAIEPELEQEVEEEGFDWTGAQIGLLQAAFSYGYTFFMIPGGRMSEIYGAKWVIFLSGFGSALCSVMTPLLANSSFTLLVSSRVFMGLCQTGISPALYAMFSRWLPPDESSVYLPMIKVGVMLGFMAGSLVNGFLPWQLMFYLLGLVGFVWSAGWAYFASSLPSEHKFIDKREQEYIQYCLDQRTSTVKTTDKSEPNKTNAEDGGNKKVISSSRSAPWLRIIKNPIVLAFTFTKFTVKLSTDTQTMQIPMYLRNVFQISDQLNGILNGANFAIQAVFTGLIAYTAKEMVVRQQFGLHKTGIRRLFQGINCFGMALAYLLISFNMGSLNLVCCAVILLSVTSMFGSGGEAVLPIDLTTEYAASIMAIANSAANLSGIVLPPIVSFLLANQLTSAANWNHVWWFISATMASGGIMFTCLVKAKIQGFNEGKKMKQPKGNLKSASNGTFHETDIVMGPTDVHTKN